VSDHVRISTDGGVLRLHLDKPAKRNALDDGMVATLVEQVEAAGRDEAVRAILLTAEGEHFCSGFDIVGRNDGDDAAGASKPRVGAIQRRLPSEAHRLIPLLCEVQVPIVCAARGWIAGIGLHLAAACDLTVVAQDARVWEPFAQRGFTPDSGGTWLLPRLVGLQRARELLLLGRRISGTDAAEWGLFHQAVPDGSVDEVARGLATELAAGPTVSLGLTKWLLHTSADHSLHQHLRDEAFAIELSSRSEDFREGLQAFVQKRDPEFRGR
jgi:2-(1,2-epoxy-1,2-dihydrophenyl)acetyl-CoA isomerase